MTVAIGVILFMFAFVALPARTQEITGVPDSPDAKAMIDGPIAGDSASWNTGAPPKSELLMLERREVYEMGVCSCPMDSSWCFRLHSARKGFWVGPGH
jgi:hypothetical protein